jgi:hypothetical protein
MVNVILDSRSGLHVTPSTTREGWGQVCLQSTQTVINNGIATPVNRKAWVKGPVELLTKEFKLNQQKNGKIIRITSDTPFYDGQSPVINPNSGEVVMRRETNAPFYQNHQYTEDLTASDYHLISTVVKEEIPTNAIATA